MVEKTDGVLRNEDGVNECRKRAVVVDCIEWCVKMTGKVTKKKCETTETKTEKANQWSVMKW